MDQNRPRTRGLEASEAEEDAKAIKAALSDLGKVNFKKIQQKLKTDYGGGGKETDSEDEEKIFYNQPPFDDEEGKPGVKRRRYGGGRRYAKKKGKADATGAEEEIRRPTISARLIALLKAQNMPKIVPYDKSIIEYKQERFKLGDIVSIEGADKKHYAQLLGFHTDQFCERYATIRWLLPGSSTNVKHGQLYPVRPEFFTTYTNGTRPINMRSCKFVLRPPAWFTHEGTRTMIHVPSYYIFNNETKYLDIPTETLTSAERR